MRKHDQFDEWDDNWHDDFDYRHREILKDRRKKKKIKNNLKYDELDGQVDDYQYEY